MDYRHPKGQKFAKRQRFDKVESVRLESGEDAFAEVRNKLGFAD